MGAMAPRSARRLLSLIELGVELERLLLHFQRFDERDQVPVEGDDVGDGRHHLVLEGEVGDVPLVLGDADGAVVDRRPEALKQVLLDRQARGSTGYTGRNMLNGEFWVTPNWLPMPSWTLVPVRKPCWMPALDDLYSVTRKFVPVILVRGLDRRVVHELAVDEERRVEVGNRRAGQLHVEAAEHAAGAAARPPPPVPPEPSCVLARTPMDADDGPCEMVFETLRSSAPALARSRLASASFGL